MNTPTLKTVDQLPPFESDAVWQPLHFLVPDREKKALARRIHITLDDDGDWLWAHLFRVVSGWQVLAAGTFPIDAMPDAETVAREVDRRYLEGGASGTDLLPREAHLQRGIYVHIRRDDTPSTALCGATGDPAEFDTTKPRHAEQHCTDCDAAYRAAHYGRVAVTY